jgi:predicted dehydrogenase
VRAAGEGRQDVEPHARVALVGLGLASSAHYKGYLSHPASRVVAVCDADLERARRFARDQRIPRAYRSFDEVLADREVNTVDIATPTYLHGEMARQAAEAGMHVHCEKPFCCTLGEGRRAAEAVERSGVKLVVGETYVFLASHMEARRLIEQGEIGRPLQIRQRHGAWIARSAARVYTGPPDRNWRIDPRASGGGRYPWIFDHAVHFFATAEYLMMDGRISEVYALSAGQASGGPRAAGAAHDPYVAGEVDTPVITWKYDDPACQGLWARAERLNGKYDYMRGFSTTVIGERGLIEVLGEGGDNLFWEGKKQHLVLHREGKDTVCLRFEGGGDDVWESEISYYSDGHIRQIHHLLDCVVSGAEPRYGARDGMRAVQCTLAAIWSAEELRPVKVEEIDDSWAAYTTAEGS